MGRVFIKNGRVMPGFPGFNLQDRKGRGGKSPSFRVVSRTACTGELRRSRNRMKAESFAIITFTPPSTDINIR